MIAAGAVIVAAGAAAVWFSGILSGGGAEPPSGPETGVPVPAVTDTAAQATDTATARDTTQFGPVGFNAVSRTAGAPVSSDTAPRADTGVVAAVPDSLIAVQPETVGLVVPPVNTTPTAVVPPPPAPTLPTIVVPPGYATTAEIVVVPGLEVLSVAEIGVGGQIGHRVVQRTPEGIELSIQAVPGGFGADTVGARNLQVTTEADTAAVGTLRFWGYQVEARAALPANTLSTLLTQLERRRPVN